MDKTHNTVIEYIEMMKAGEESKMPVHYTNYHYIIKISLENGSLVEAHSDFHDVPSERNLRVPDFMDLKVDQENHTASCIMKIKENDEERTSFSRMKLKPDFPVLNGTSLFFIGPRFLDISDKGIIYLIEPLYAKEPLPCTFKILGREIIDTKAGRFNTIKIGLAAADPFLGKLLSSIVQNVFFWVEDSPRHLVVKTHILNDTTILDEISVWKEK